MNRKEMLGDEEGILAYTLAKVSPNESVAVIKRIEKLPLISEVTLVYGEYDVLVKTQTRNVAELNGFIYNVLRRIPHITMTTTMIVANIPKKK
ncbi:Lrp/AsnC family transcriptional regulator [Candidatus Bathyarchaeota archaeon]|nr:MAG: Lrp/AsnC family transcriptional regulator [Candidatus Bathyarchaeota archaeon]